MTPEPVSRPGRALAFSNLAHYYNHVIMLLFPTVALVLENEWGLSFGALLNLAFLGFLVYGLAALPAGWKGGAAQLRLSVHRRPSNRVRQQRFFDLDKGTSKVNITIGYIYYIN